MSASKLACLAAHLALAAKTTTNSYIVAEDAAKVLKLARRHCALWQRFGDPQPHWKNMTQDEVAAATDDIILQIRRDVLRDNYRVGVQEKCDPRYATVLLVTARGAMGGGDMVTYLP